MYGTHSTSQVTTGTFQGFSGHVWLMATLKDSAAPTSLDQRGVFCLAVQGSKGVTTFKIHGFQMPQTESVSAGQSPWVSPEKELDIKISESVWSPRWFFCVARLEATALEAFTCKLPGSSDFAPPHLQGHLHSKHVQWGGGRAEMGKVGECVPWGPFSSPTYRIAVSTEKSNPACLSGCDHA